MPDTSPSAAPRVVLVDGAQAPDGRVPVDADDLGLVRGVAVFETLRTHDGALPHLPVHLDRLAGSAAALGVPLPDRELLAAELVQAAALIQGEASLRLLLTHGGTRVVRAAPLAAPPDVVHAALRPWAAQDILSGRVKHTSRALSHAALRQAGTDEVLWVDDAGLLLEGTWSNVFAVRGGVLHTPADDGRILPGVTRSRVLSCAEALDIPVAEGPTPAEGGWTELYISSSLKLLVPVVSLDGATAPGEGPVGRRLVAQVADAYQR